MTMVSNFFDDVGTFFENLWEKHILPRVGEVFGIATAFFSAAIEESAKQLGETGLRIITDAVTAAEQQGGDGAAKWDAAVDKIDADLSAAGITAAKNVINAAIEAAVAQMNAAKAKQVVADAGGDPNAGTA